MAPVTCESIVRFCRDRFHRMSIKSDYFLTLPREDQIALARDWDIPLLYAIATLDPPRTAAVVAHVLNDRFNTWLSQYVPDPETFRSRMRGCNAVISGSAALKFIDPGLDFIPNDIDVYVADHTYELFCTYLVSGLHGETISCTSIPRPFVDHVVTHSSLYDGRPLGICERRVIKTPLVTFDVLRSRTITPQTAIAHFQSTHVMNYISADTLVIAYPRTTLQRVGILAARRFTDKFATKYDRRGFMLHESPLDFWGTTYKTICVPEGYCPRDRRIFGDMFSLCLRWDEVTLRGEVPERGDVETAVWTLGGDGCGHWECIGRIPHRVHTILLETTNIAPAM